MVFVVFQSLFFEDVCVEVFVIFGLSVSFVWLY